jgi:hypothetical protein
MKDDNHEEFVGYRFRLWRKATILKARHEVDGGRVRHRNAEEYLMLTTIVNHNCGYDASVASQDRSVLVMK